MDTRKILVSWIGSADVTAMYSHLERRKDRDTVERSGIRLTQATGDGPVKTLLGHVEFSEVHLVSNYHRDAYQRETIRLFASWLGCRPSIHQAELDDPTDYAEVFRVTDELLQEVTGRSGPGTQLCMHLSSGTPAMTAIWVLLGKSRYPATFYQTHQGRAWKTEIPFDLLVDYVPELLRDSDASLQYLAARSPEQIAGFQDIIGNSRAIRLAVGRAHRAAVRDVAVLLLGESGTGKEMFARAIHAASHRKDRPFRPVNCAAVPVGLLESELFGHRRGAFTDAKQDRKGEFEMADGGTLFLDEIGECDPVIQVKLLRVLQPPKGADACHRVFRPVGEERDRTSNVRVIAATNRDLLRLVSEGRFREDLYYRLAAITIKLPPLRERSSDIPPLATDLLRRVNEDFRKKEPGYRDKTLSADAKSFTKAYHWPGNIRQLHNALTQAAVMAEGEVIQRRDLSDAVEDVPGEDSASLLDRRLGGVFRLQLLLEDVQRHYLERAMKEADGCKTKAARLLGYSSYQTLDAQLKRLGVALPGGARSARGRRSS